MRAALVGEKSGDLVCCHCWLAVLSAVTRGEMLVANAIIQEKSKVSTFAPNAQLAKAVAEDRPLHSNRVGGTASSLLFLTKLYGQSPSVEIPLLDLQLATTGLSSSWPG